MMRKTIDIRARGMKTAAKATVVPANALYRAIVKSGSLTQSRYTCYSRFPRIKVELIDVGIKDNGNARYYHVEGLVRVRRHGDFWFYAETNIPKYRHDTLIF